MRYLRKYTCKRERYLFSDRSLRSTSYSGYNFLSKKEYGDFVSCNACDLRRLCVSAHASKGNPIELDTDYRLILNVNSYTKLCFYIDAACSMRLVYDKQRCKIFTFADGLFTIEEYPKIVRRSGRIRPINYIVIRDASAINA